MKDFKDRSLSGITADTGSAPITPTISIWWFAFGYFAAYVPYSALVKHLSNKGIQGLELLPITAIASLVGMFIFITAMRWWRYASRSTFFGYTVPFPRKWTLLSGICTAAIIPTTTLAYTFSGISIVFMMLLMRGGVLIIAPIVDRISGRRVRWFSWAALLLSLSALVAAFAGRYDPKIGFSITMLAAIDVVIYLMAYFFRLRFMSKLAKSEHEDDRRRYFVEEQMTATPVLVGFLALYALLGVPLLGPESSAAQIVKGFAGFLTYGAAAIFLAIAIGIFSQFTGIFGGLVLLDKRENTYCVPVNRASSIIAGLVASLCLMLFTGKGTPSGTELIGAALILIAIAFLSIPPIIEKNRYGRK